MVGSAESPTRKQHFHRIAFQISEKIVLTLILIIRSDIPSLPLDPLKHLPIKPETRVQSLGWEDLLEKEMATHSSTLAWKIPWTEEPGRLQSMGWQSRTRLSDFTSLHDLDFAKLEISVAYCFPVFEIYRS